MDMLEKAKSLLEEGDSTLVVVNGQEWRKFHQRGVADLVWLLDNDSKFLCGSSIADKIIGRAAASLMIMSKVKCVFSRVMTNDALAMFEQHKIPASYGTLTAIVENRTKTGRCPLDTLCSGLTTPEEMVNAIREFLTNHNTDSK